jgi:hypothetical protein
MYEMSFIKFSNIVVQKLLCLDFSPYNLDLIQTQKNILKARRKGSFISDDSQVPDRISISDMK